MYKLIMEANGQKHEKTFTTMKEAYAAGQVIHKFDYPAESTIVRIPDSVVVAWSNHCPYNKKGEKWRM